MAKAVRAAAKLAGAGFCLLLTACAIGMQGDGGDPCLGDSPACVQQRVGLVNAMASDPQRAWISRSPSRPMIASGVRQFVYQKTQGQLSCGELAAGMREMDADMRALAQGPVPGQSAERHTQIKALTADVHAQLVRTSRSRCKG